MFRVIMIDVAGSLIRAKSTLFIATLRSMVSAEKDIRKGGAEARPGHTFLETCNGCVRFCGGYFEQRRGSAFQIVFVLTKAWYTIFGLLFDISGPK